MACRRSQVRSLSGPPFEKVRPSRRTLFYIASDSPPWCCHVLGFGENCINRKIMPVPTLYTNGSYLLKNPSWHREDAPWKLSHILRVLNSIHVTQMTRVLDAGCGTGDIIKLWSQKSPEVQFVGWEVSPQAYMLARADEPHNVKFVCAPEPPAGWFDLVLAIDVIEHLEHPDAWFKNLSSHASLFVLHVPLDLSVRSFLFPSLLERERQTVGHIHFFTARSLKQFLQKNNCQILSMHYTNKYVERPPKLTSWKSRLGMCIRQLAHKLLPHAWAAFWIGGYSLIVVAKTNRDTTLAKV